jgi:2-phosphosulfolactate phosphatase
VSALALDVALVPRVAAAGAPAAVAVVIDVLRATSTIVTALDAGAAGIVPVRDHEEAIAVARRLGRDRTLLCGERASRLIAGFDLDNSPASYAPEVVAGKTLVFTTTNGTRALTEARAGAVLCAALLNRAAVVDALAAAAGDVLLICAGNEGAVSFEDLLCAGAIVDGLQREHGAFEPSDAARAARAVFAGAARRLPGAVASGTHARALVRAGFGDDVAACARIDVSKRVPRFANGLIIG